MSEEKKEPVGEVKGVNDDTDKFNEEIDRKLALFEKELDPSKPSLLLYCILYGVLCFATLEFQLHRPKTEMFVLFAALATQFVNCFMRFCGVTGYSYVFHS